MGDLSAIFIQLLGIIASLFMIFAYANKSDDRFKIFLTIGTFILACHFLFLGAFAGMAVSLINSARIGLSIKFHKSNLMMICFLGSYLATGIILYKEPLDILPVFSGCLGAVAMYKLSGLQLRLSMSVVSLMWLSHNFLYGSIGGIITELFISSTNIVTIIRLIKDRKSERI